MRIAIIGAGISGLIARGAFEDGSNEVDVFDSKKKAFGVFPKHFAVMRLRDDKIKKYLNCKLQKITTHKAVYHNGMLHDKPTLLLNNLYSLKIYSSLSDRSIGDLGKMDRFLIKDIKDYDAYIEKPVTGISYAGLRFADGSQVPYDAYISTIPMPDIIRLAEYKTNIKFEYSPIHVMRAKLSVMSDVHQTLYFTDKDPCVPYRVTIEGDTLIAESLEEFGTEIDECLSAFGIDHTYLTDFKRYEQKIGKIKPIDDDERRKIMMDLTNDYNIYSFGRFATWRSLRIDQTLDDIEKIKLFLRLKHKIYYKD